MKSILIGLTALTCHLALAAPQGSPPTQAQVAFQVITQQSDLRTFGSEETFKNLKATDLVAHGLSDGHLLYQLSVAAGAYNTATAFAILEDQTTARLLTFSEPILYKADGKPVQVAGWTTKTSLMGGDYSQTIKNEVKTDFISSTFLGRAKGDSYSAGTYELWQGQAVLRHFEHDPTFDDEQNPEVLFHSELPLTNAW